MSENIGRVVYCQNLISLLLFAGILAVHSVFPDTLSAQENSPDLQYLNVQLAHLRSGTFSKLIRTSESGKENQQPLQMAISRLALAESGRTSEAVKQTGVAVEQVGELNPDNRTKKGIVYACNAFALCRFGDYSKALESAMQAVELLPESAFTQYCLALVYYSRGEYELCEHSLANSLKQDSKFALAYYLRANLRSSCFQGELALADFKKSIMLDSRFVVSAAIYCMELAAAGEFERSHEIFTQFENTTTGYFGLYSSRAFLYQRQNEPEKAMEYAEKAIELNPNHFATVSSKCYLLHQMQRWKDAENLARETVKKHPKLVYSHLMLGDVLKSSDLEQAVKSYQHAAQLNPTHFRPLLSIGLALFENGRNTEAINYLQKASSLHKRNIMTYVFLGDAQLADKQYAEAIKSYSKSIELVADLGAVYEKRSDAYAAIGKAEEAKADRAKAVELGWLEE